MGVYIRSELIAEKRDIEKMTSPSPARPKTTPSSAKLSAGRIVKTLRARNSPLNDKVKRCLLAKLEESSMSTSEMNAGT